VAIVSGNRWALMHELRGEDEPTLAAIIDRLAPCDIVLVEGYKREAHKKIEMRRLGARETTPLAPGDPLIVAIAADHPVDAGGLALFDIDAVEAIADFVEKTTGLRNS
jgi:molybdopterin-guanine dinucleotide biosynthesis protein B